jgi:hypothetical protein
MMSNAAAPTSAELAFRAEKLNLYYGSNLAVGDVYPGQYHLLLVLEYKLTRLILTYYSFLQKQLMFPRNMTSSQWFPRKKSTLL